MPIVQGSKKAAPAAKPKAPAKEVKVAAKPAAEKKVVKAPAKAAEPKAAKKPVVVKPVATKPAAKAEKKVVKPTGLVSDLASKPLGEKRPAAPVSNTIGVRAALSKAISSAPPLSETATPGFNLPKPAAVKETPVKTGSQGGLTMGELFKSGALKR